MDLQYMEVYLKRRQFDCFARFMTEKTSMRLITSEKEREVMTMHDAKNTNKHEARRMLRVQIVIFSALLGTLQSDSIFLTSPPKVVLFME